MRPAQPHAVRPAPLAGKVVGIDPGHNGGNFSDPSFINPPVWNGREEEACDTTGTETDAGYTEALFNFKVAIYLRADLIAEGAKVVMTRRTNTGVGPCITRRARILNKAGSDVAIDIHADGGPASGRGVAILTPVADGPNDHVIASSRRFGRILLNRYTRVTGIPISNYDGSGGFRPARQPRGPQPHHCPQGPDRVREHAQRHRRRPPRQTVLPAARRQVDGRGDHALPAEPRLTIDMESMPVAA